MSPLGHPQDLIRIIATNQLNPVFQPIVDLKQVAMFGYEALIRGPADSALHSPLALFETASRHGLMAALEYACREVSCTRFAHFGIDGKLFLNVSPMSLVEQGYREGMTHAILAHLGLPADRIVIELSEHYPFEDYDVMRCATTHFREMGFEIAIDDLGAGYAGLRAWSELRPDYVKIDRHFIEHIDEDPVKREFVRSIQEIAQELGCRVVAEGIETAAELAAVQALGIRFGQGYYLGRPQSRPANHCAVLDKLHSVSPLTRQLPRHSHTVRELAHSVPSISPETSLDTVIDLFHHNRQWLCLPIVEAEKPQGLVQRADLLELYTARYSRELHGKKPVRLFMDHQPVIVPESTPLEEVSRLLTDSNDRLSQDFIITRNGGYYGIGKTSALLRRITDQQIRSARYANPLTMLPGNVPIHEILDERLAVSDPFWVAYCDLNHFKAYNDYYGYSRGDEVIVCLAQTLAAAVDPGSDFVGHIGGDDFVVVFRSQDWEQRCNLLLELFAQYIRRLYEPRDLEHGGIRTRSRSGETQFFEVVSLAIGVVHPDPVHCTSHHDIATLASDAKREAKAIGGNCLFVSRRRRPDSAILALAQ